MIASDYGEENNIINARNFLTGELGTLLLQHCLAGDPPTKQKDISASQRNWNPQKNDILKSKPTAVLLLGLKFQVCHFFGTPKNPEMNFTVQTFLKCPPSPPPPGISVMCVTSVMVCPFGIGIFPSQKKHEKLFCECIFALLNLKRKVNIEGQHVC